ncbi:MAG: hypothetical protein LUH09_03015 [Clostridiales bacterium]|nr:hypothetical protein [Clostridiales bacterium]
MIRNSSGTVKMLTVDTSDIGSYNSGSVSYNTPIASVSDLAYGSYTVIIYVSTPDDGFIFDGFRVYDTCKNDTDAIAVYTTDLEDDPDYYELRNNVLAGLNVSTDEEDTIYASDIAKTTLAQVYATGTNNTSGAVVYYSSSVVKEGTDVQTPLDDGPKNELYLYPGMSVIFTINTSQEVQIGLRSVTGESVSYGSTDTKTVTVY